MRKIEARLLRELIANSKRSDRELARAMGTTQPTVGRLRKKLEKEGYVSEYTLIPDLAKLDVEFIAFTAIAWGHYQNQDKLKEFREYIRQSHFVFFSAPGEGLQGKTKLIVSLHRDYKSYELFIRKIRAHWAPMIDSMETFLVSTDNIIRQFTFEGVASMLEAQDEG